MGGKVQNQRFYISTGFDDTPVNRQRVGDIVRMVQRDLDYGEVDLTLERYKPRATLITVSPMPPISPNEQEDPEITLDQLWDRYAHFKKPQVSPSPFAKDFPRHHNHISQRQSET